MAEWFVLFVQGVLASSILGFYWAFTRFVLYGDGYPMSMKHIEKCSYSFVAKIYKFLVIALFFVLAYYLIEYGIYYFTLSPKDVAGVIGYRAHLTLSEGAGLTFSLCLGALFGVFFAWLLYALARKAYLQRFNPIALSLLLGNLLYRTEMTSYSAYTISLNIDESQNVNLDRRLEQWVKRSFNQLAKVDKHKIAPLADVSVIIDLASGDYHSNPALSLDGPELIMKSLRNLPKLELKSGNVLMSTEQANGPMMITICAEFIDRDDHSSHSVEQLRLVRIKSK